MTTGKIAISLPTGQLARVRAAVRRGRAASVSAYIADALARQEREDTLAEFVKDLVEGHGQPTAEEKRWARQLLRRSDRA